MRELCMLHCTWQPMPQPISDTVQLCLENVMPFQPFYKEARSSAHTVKHPAPTLASAAPCGQAPPHESRPWRRAQPIEPGTF